MGLPKGEKAGDKIDLLTQLTPIQSKTQNKKSTI